MTIEHDGMTSARSWVEWKRACAVDLCDEASADDLRRFGYHLFRTQLRKYSSRTGHGGKPMTVGEEAYAWHLLETHARVSSTRAGKRYKDWLFSREPDGPGWLKAVEAGAVLLMRNAVRDYLRREHAPWFMSSMDVPSQSIGFTVGELIPDGADTVTEVASREEDDIAADVVRKMLPGLSDREKLALRARAVGLALNDNRVLARAGCRGSTLYEIHRSLVERCCFEIKDRSPQAPAAGRVRMAALALDGLAEKCAGSFPEFTVSHSLEMV